MSRFLVLSALAACGTTPARTPVDQRVSFDAWVQRWSEARACVVAPAQDLETGVAIAIQQGRECSGLLARLDVQVGVRMELQRNTLPALKELIRRVRQEQFSSSKRTELIWNVDGLLAALVAETSELQSTQPWVGSAE